MFLSLSLENLEIAMIVVWAIIAIAAVIIEIETISLVSIWFAIGSVAAIISLLLGAPVWLQFIIFAGVSAICVVATRPLVKKISDNQTVLTNADRLVGKVAIVTKDIFDGEKGEVKVEFQNWPAISSKNKNYNVGEKVLIKEIVGNKLIIDDIEEIEIK